MTTPKDACAIPAGGTQQPPAALSMSLMMLATLALAIAPESASGRLRSMLRGMVLRWEGKRGRTSHAPNARTLDGPAPLIGRVSMDQCSIDLTDMPSVDRGDEVILPVRRVNTSPAIPRIYVRAVQAPEQP